MGRNLALGIPTRITIFKNEKYAKNNFKLLDNKNKVLEKLSKMINKDDYNIECDKDDDTINLIIDENFVNDNIHNCIIEIADEIGIYGIRDTFFAENRKIDINKYNQKNFPIKLEYNDKLCFDETNHLYLSENTYYIIAERSYNTDSTYMESFKPYFSQEYWLLDFDKSLYYNTKIYIEYMPIWINIDKYSGDDEVDIIYLMNKFSRNHFKNKLSNDLLFFIMG